MNEENSPLPELKAPGKKPKTGGRLPVITPADAVKVAELEAQGLALSKCLRLVNRRWTLNHWRDSLAQDTILAEHYEEKLGTLQLEMLKTIRGTDRSKLPVGTCWILERRFGTDYAQPKAGGGSGSNQTTFNGPVQINVAGKSALKSLLRKVVAPPAPGKGNPPKLIE